MAHDFAEDFGGNSIQRQHLANCIALYRFPGHSPNYAGSLILGYCIASGIAHFLESLGTIAAHSSQQYANPLRTDHLAHGSKQYVHRWTVAVHERSVRQPAQIAHTATHYQQMVTTRCNIHIAC